VCQEDRSVLRLVLKQRHDRYDLNQLRTEPWIPDQNERLVIKMSWSIVSTAAERSSKQRHDTFCDPIALTRRSWMYKRPISVEWCMQKAEWWEFSKLWDLWDGIWRRVLLFWKREIYLRFAVSWRVLFYPMLVSLAVVYSLRVGWNWPVVRERLTILVIVGTSIDEQSLRR